MHIVLQIAEALRMIHEEGVDRVLHRHAKMSERVRHGVRELGLELQCPVAPSIRRDGDRDLAAGASTQPSCATASRRAAFSPPPDSRAFSRRAFRIGHMGDIRLADVERTLGALAEILAVVARTQTAVLA